MYSQGDSRHDGTERFASVKRGGAKRRATKISKTGLLLSGIFFALAILVISAQGLFYRPEALMIGLPWSLLITLIPSAVVLPVWSLYLLVLVPIALNAAALYAIGYGISLLHNQLVNEW